MRRVTFCDLATFYCPTGGGIRTYYDAKLDWFRHQTDHRYTLIVPAERSSIRAVSPSATVVEARGTCMARASDSYRLFTDIGFIRQAIRNCGPDVLETGDPWISGPLALWIRRRDRVPAILSAFFHSDPKATYVEPALARHTPAPVAHAVSAWAGRAFYRLQCSYDITLVSSAYAAEQLSQGGIRHLRRVPFGVDAIFFKTGRHRQPAFRPQRRLLYAGRLDRDKHVDRLITILPHLLDDPAVFVTVAGTGLFRATFERWTHPRVRYVGFVRDREALAALYGDHDVFLAPGPYETFGLAALEAAAAGLVIVGPDRGATGALLREMHSPFVFRAGDSNDFLMMTRAALDADWAPASHASRRLAARYGTWREAIGRLVDTYQRILENRPCLHAPYSCHCTT